MPLPRSAYTVALPVCVGQRGRFESPASGGGPQHVGSPIEPESAQDDVVTMATGLLADWEHWRTDTRRMGGAVVSTEFGPQYVGDDALTARMRLHQSWWRAERLRVPFGTDQKGTAYGNYLNEVDAAAGLNFLTPAIHHTAQERMSTGAGVEPNRCTKNLLSSQPMAFNLFGPLRADPTLAAVLFGPLLPGGVTAASVHIEWAPPRALHLGDATSFDVAVRYTTRMGLPALAGVECKLTEPFSQTVYGERPDDPRTESYRAVARNSQVWLDPEEQLLTDRRWNQVWRNHLLIESIRQREPGLLGCEIIVHHPLDTRCATACADYSEFLANPDDTFRVLTLSRIVETWRPLLRRAAERRWLGDFADRYVRLELSERGPVDGELVVQRGLLAVRKRVT